MAVSKNRKRKVSRHRNVYVIARPLQSAGPASFLSEGKFPFCHWGLLVTKFKEVEMSRRIRNVENTVRDPSRAKPWGTLFELCRDAHDKNTYNVEYDFEGEEWYLEWKHISVAFIGNTDVSDEKLAEEGESHIDRIITNKLSATQIVRDHPDYHAYTNNCQNFVIYLLAVACPGSVIPNDDQNIYNEVDHYRNCEGWDSFHCFYKAVGTIYLSGIYRGYFPLTLYR